MSLDHKIAKVRTLLDAVQFYNTRFALGLTAQEKTDLVNFLSVL